MKTIPANTTSYPNTSFFLLQLNMKCVMYIPGPPNRSHRNICKGLEDEPTEHKGFKGKTAKAQSNSFGKKIKIFTKIQCKYNLNSPFKKSLDQNRRNEGKHSYTPD